MARGRVKKVTEQAPVQAKEKGPAKAKVQEDQLVFALDIGTRSLIGMVGTVEDNKVKIIAIEREEHAERAMIDGQIENIEKVAALADKVKKKLEKKIHCKLNHVCVAAAGRALRTERADFELSLPNAQLIDDEIISRLEAGAISKAEEAFEAENDNGGIPHRFYLVGYTVCQYYLDQYMISSLKDHRGQQVKVDLIATFLPSEVVESLYTTMHKIGLEVASITLEPIAAINAAIPENLRLLNLVMVDIGAGTSDIAACTNGSVTGYTMATVAGDEVTESIMKEYLVDFETAEMMKAKAEQCEEITFTDILGFERKVAQNEILGCIQKTIDVLCSEIADKVLEVNGGPPSALFLAGGGSKLTGLKDKITSVLQMDATRVAIAGNNFRINAFSDEYDLNNPEYATPLGIAISSGLNKINDSFRVILNEHPAKLFRSGSFTALNLLMMNGYSYQDILGRSGRNLIVTINGTRKVFYGTAAQPASLFINKKEGKLSDVIHAGDNIDFIPAVSGESARVRLGDIEGASTCLDITLNGAHAPLRTLLKNGDSIVIRMPEPQPPAEDGRFQANDTVETAGRRSGPEGGAAEETAHITEPGPAAEDANPAGTAAPGTENIPSPDASHDSGSAPSPESAHGTASAPSPESAHGAENAASPEAASAAGPSRSADAVPAIGNARSPESAHGAASAPSPESAHGTASAPSPESAHGAENVPSTEAAHDIEHARFAEAGPDIDITHPDEAAADTGNPLPAAVSAGSNGARHGEEDFPIGSTLPAKENPALENTFPLQADSAASSARPAESVSAVKDTYAPKTPGPAIHTNPAESQAEPAAEKPIINKAAPAPEPAIVFHLNGSPLRLPRKDNGEPYYLMDMIQYSGIDLKHPKGTITLKVNGIPGMFQQSLREGDNIYIGDDQ